VALRFDVKPISNNILNTKQQKILK
jgi:hypothetical protein